MSDKVTRYGVARGEKIIGLMFDAIDEAKEHFANVSAAMVSVDLEPDVRLVEADYSVAVSKLRAYREPEPAAAPEPAE